MKVRTAELIGPQLDWAVAKADQPIYSDRALIDALEGGYDGIGNRYEAFQPSTNWSQAGPIIGREGLNLFRHNKINQDAPWVWRGHVVAPLQNMEGRTNLVAINRDGPTPLIASMRCYVASKLGDEIEIPQELCK